MCSRCKNSKSDIYVVLVGKIQEVRSLCAPCAKELKATPVDSLKWKDEK